MFSESGYGSTLVEELEHSQDNEREFAQIALFGLIINPGRLGHDATCLRGFKYELKTTTKKSGGVSTARDLLPHKLDEWRERYWIVTRGKKPKGKPFVPQRHFFLAPVHMEAFYAKLDAGFDADKNLGLKIEDLARDGLTEAELARTRALIRRGMSLNDPTIPWSYIVANGIEITENYVETLAELVQRFPIEVA